MLEARRKFEVASHPEDYPREAFAQQEIIRAFFAAIKNTTEIWDKPKVAVAFTNGDIPDLEIEILC
jgi:hypothetical protein